MTVRHLAAWMAAALIAIANSGAASAQEVLLSEDQAIREIFPEAARTTRESRPLDAATRRGLEQRLGRRIDDDTIHATLVYGAGGEFRGYAVVTEEIGKYRPITFMVGVTPAFTVRDVAVMVYRESRGGEVRRRRFLDQYRGKKASDPIDVNRDIISISGATLSVRSLNAGVKRVLAEVAAVYGNAREK